MDKDNFFNEVIRVKFYAVKSGRKPGIYRTWEETKKQVDGFSGAEYKSFDKVTDATEYMNFGKEERDRVMEKDENALNEAANKIIKFNPKSDDYFAYVYTDGGTRNSGAGVKGGSVAPTDKAAWAYLIEWNGKRISNSGGEYGATNNKMEQTGFINALEKLIELGFNEKKLMFRLDSKYVLQPITEGWLEGWKKRGWKKSSGELANVEEWKKIDKLLANFPDAHFEWVKGHANHPGNEFVDGLLNQYMDEEM